MTERGELLAPRQVRHVVDVDVPAPEVAWHLAIGWYRDLGEGAVPLGPRRGLAIGGVERAGERAALPATVARGLGAEKRIGGAGYLAPPTPSMATAPAATVRWSVTLPARRRGARRGGSRLAR
jgi:hypothetical protein